MMKKAKRLILVALKIEAYRWRHSLYILQYSICSNKDTKKV